MKFCIRSTSSRATSFQPNSMYQWTHRESTVPMTPGKLESAVIWPHSNDKKTSPKGESKIPKLMASSTPKARIQLISSLITMTEQAPQPPPTAPETDHNKVNELKMKMGKCETIQEMFLLIKSFLSEYNMQSSESSSNSGVFTGSMLNGSDSTVFDRSLETTMFNVMQHRAPEPKTTPKSKSFKSRTTPSTPTGTTTRTDPKRFRRNLSVEAVNSASPTKSTETVNGNGCKRCAQMLTSPVKTSVKRMVDKATVMDVDPIVFPSAPELISIETQTEDIEVKEIKKEEKPAAAAPIPPPPPPPMNIPPPPPPPPLLNIPKPPGEIAKFLN